jgi:uncharacterized protein with NRDE domain
MCLILFAWESHPDYSLVVAANRDEFYSRPTAPIGWWEERTSILGGRDKAEVIGTPGTWMGISTNGRFAAITNVRAPTEKNPLLKTRGEISSEYLFSELTPSEFVESSPSRFNNYNGFNLLMGDFTTPKDHKLNWLTNRRLINGEIYPSNLIEATPLNSGVYGLSNAMLNTPWPKITNCLPKFKEAIEADTGDFSNNEEYLKLLSDNTVAPDNKLPKTGVSNELERILSSAFIKTENYGTRSSSILRVRRDGYFEFLERRFDHNGLIDTNSIKSQFTSPADLG